MHADGDTARTQRSGEPLSGDEWVVEEFRAQVSRAAAQQASAFAAIARDVPVRLSGLSTNCHRAWGAWHDPRRRSRWTESGVLHHRGGKQAICGLFLREAGLLVEHESPLVRSIDPQPHVDEARGETGLDMTVGEEAD